MKILENKLTNLKTENNMKTIEEINKNIEAAKERLQESYDDEAKNAQYLTQEQVINYKKTQSYIKGWIDELSGVYNPEYMNGSENAKMWRES